MTVQLLDILTEEEAIPAEVLDRVREQQRKVGGCLADHILRAKLISEDDLFYLMSQRMGVPPLAEDRLLHHNLAPEVRRRVPMRLAEECVLLPLDFNADKTTLSVVMLDPTDEWVGERLRGAARVAILRPYIARRSSILEAIRSVYGRQHRYPIPPSDMAKDRPAVEAIRGKVEIDAGLVEEIASIEDDLAAEMMATSVKSLIRGVGSQVDDDAPTPAPWPKRPLASRAAEDTDETLAPPPRPDEMTNEVPLVPTAPSELSTADFEEEHKTPTRATGDAAAVTVAGPADHHEVAGEPDTIDRHAIAAFDSEIKELEASQPADDDVDFTEGTGRWGTERDYDGAPDYDETVAGEGAAVVLTPDLPDDVSVALLGELFGAVGVLVSMLEERVDPGGALAREHARLSRLVAREIGLDSLTIDRVTVAAHLYGLDIALRRELEGERLHNVAETFSSKPTRPGGLNPTLRSLGARALGLSDGTQSPLGATLITLVSDYLDLRLESCEDSSETVVQLLRASGADGQLVDALMRVLDDEETLVETRRSQIERRQQRE